MAHFVNKVILSPKGKCLFISTRRCATATMYSSLGALNWERVEKGGDSPKYHAIPKERLAPMHITICRNPYDRALSIWAWTNRKVRRSFDAWLDCLVTKAFEDEDDPHMFEACAPFHDTFLHDHVVRMEEMPRAFVELTGVRLKWLVRKHQTCHPGAETLTHRQRARIYAWAEEDFERYGYRK